MPLIDAKTLASELGFTAKQVRRLAHAGKIPSMRFASEYRFDLEQVKAAAAYRNEIQRSAHEAARRAWLPPKRRTS